MQITASITAYAQQTGRTIKEVAAELETIKTTADRFLALSRTPAGQQQMAKARQRWNPLAQ